MTNTKEKLWMDIFNRHPDLADKILEIYDELSDEMIKILYDFIDSGFDDYTKPIKNFLKINSFKEISGTDKNKIANTDK